jgi:hypothetical protein
MGGLGARPFARQDAEQGLGSVSMSLPWKTTKSPLVDQNFSKTQEAVRNSGFAASALLTNHNHAVMVLL